MKLILLRLSITPALSVYCGLRLLYSQLRPNFIPVKYDVSPLGRLNLCTTQTLSRLLCISPLYLKLTPYPKFNLFLPISLPSAKSDCTPITPKSPTHNLTSIYNKHHIPSTLMRLNANSKSKDLNKKLELEAKLAVSSLRGQ